jgi:glycosyltransferase involved in cell wall biosynthesis
LARFILIDPSIKELGGHHYPYAAHVLAAAARAGYAPVLAAHRRFLPPPDGPPTIPVFRHGHWFRQDEFPLLRWLGYPVEAFRAAGRRLAAWRGSLPADSAALRDYVVRHPLRSLLLAPLAVLAAPVALLLLLRRKIPPRFRLAERAFRALSRWAFAQAYRTKARHFGEDLGQLFTALPPEPGDVVFLATLAVEDMLGLLAYLHRDERSARASWHLLFRYNLYHGREPDYDEQDEAVRPTRDAFRQFADGAAGRRVYFYTDTAELSAQYERLGVGRFHPLPIPHTVGRPAERPRDGSVRIIYLGDARDEKGYGLLPALVERLWDDYVAPGRVRFRLQSNMTNPEQTEPAAAAGRRRLEKFPSDKVEMLTDPLTPTEYESLLLSGDVSLLPYSAANYYARSSGTLAESLAAGIPVVVPAGTWLSAQFADAVERHRLAVRRGACVLGDRQAVGDVSFRGEAKGWSAPFALPADCRGLWGELEPAERCAGTFVKVRAEFSDDTGRPLGTRHALAGPLDRPSALSVLIPVPAGATGVRLSLWNAFHGGEIRLERFGLDYLDADGLPSSAVGVAYADPDDLAAAVREVVDHYAHYRDSARCFAEEFRARHNADQLLAQVASFARQTQA